MVLQPRKDRKTFTGRGRLPSVYVHGHATGVLQPREPLRSREGPEPEHVDRGEALTRLGLAKKADGGKFALLRQNHGKLLKRKANGQVEVVANGRGDWIGWVEL